MDWKTLYRWLLNGWIRLGKALNKITSPILLGSVYFFVLTPVAAVYRLFHRQEEKRESTLVDVLKTYTKDDFIKLW